LLVVFLLLFVLAIILIDHQLVYLDLHPGEFYSIIIVGKGKGILGGMFFGC